VFSTRILLIVRQIVPLRQATHGAAVNYLCGVMACENSMDPIGHLAQSHFIIPDYLPPASHAVLFIADNLFMCVGVGHSFNLPQWRTKTSTPLILKRSHRTLGENL